jgi:diguanylate cyclase (GGDEF)-like protein
VAPTTHKPARGDTRGSRALRRLPVSHPIGVVGIVVICASLAALALAPSANAAYYAVTLVAGLVMVGLAVLAARRRRTEAALAETERALRQIQQATTELRLHDAGDALIRDPDTLLFSRQLLDESLDRELRRAAREKAPVTLLLLHVGGVEEASDPLLNEVLRSAGLVLQQHVRAFDIVCRYERHVLGILMPGLSERQATRRARELLDAVEKAAAISARPATLRVVASAGLATRRPLDPPTTAQAVLRQAHLALYQSRLERGTVVPGRPDDDERPEGSGLAG